MTAFLVRGRWLAVLAVLALAVALAACSGDDEPAAPDTPEPVPAAAAAEPDAPAADESEPAPAETDEPAEDDAGESAAAQAEPPDGAAEIRVDGDTTWQDLFDGFTSEEQSCIRDALDDDLLASALSERVLTGSATSPWQVDLFGCLAEPTAQAVFFAATVAGAEESGESLNAEERSCLRDVVADLDVTQFVATTAVASEDAAASVDFAQGMIACLPDVILRSLFEGSGMSYDDLSEEERDCLREVLGDADWSAVVAPDDPDAETAFLVGLFDCVSVAPLFDGGVDGGTAAADDDHADAPEGATLALVGASVEGALYGGDDTDMFLFAAEEGVFYRIDVGLGTLEDSILTLYDADGSELAFNDDYGESYASRIEWEAPATGDYYLAVQGWGSATGSYTLTITTLPNADDHGDQLPPDADATPVLVGGSVEGALHHGDDVDVFAFEAEEGALYRIDVVLGSLGDSVLTLYDADGRELAYNDDHGDSTASRIDWQAPQPGDYYLAVEGWGGDTGSYTLDITVFVERGSDE